MSTKFDSEGFDVSASNTAGNVIYEIGGGVTADPPPNADQNIPPPCDGPTSESERLKESGNDHFRRGNHLDAYDYYTEAIEACPCGEGIGPDGETLLRLKHEFEEEQREKNAAKHRAEMERRRSGRKENDDGDDERKKEDDDDKTKPMQKQEEFVPPRHLYGHKLAVYYANRAATLLHMGRLEEAIDDCDVAILYNPLYVKAYTRRSTANERNENTEDALRDARKAYELEPSNPTARKNVARLEKIEAERMEKLKEETMGKLKELGNSILGNFGLSLDNFQAVQDPKTGGYSISFNQNK